MSSAHRTGLLVACILGLLGALVSRPDSTAQAQARGVVAGAYKARSVNVGGREWSRQKVDELPELILLPNNRFIYGSGDDGQHGDYQAVAGGKVQLGKCVGWKADIPQPPNRNLDFKTTDGKAGIGQEIRMERLGDPHGVRPEPLYQTDCKVALTGRTTAAARDMVLTQAQQSRIIDGDIFLATRQGASPADLELWTCLVTGGYPGVEYAEDGSSTPAQRLLVLPDGRFRSRVRGGAIYRWWMLPSGCPTAPRQPLSGIGTPAGPMDPWVSGEKILLACFVGNGGLPDCAGWWLKKP